MTRPTNSFPTIYKKPVKVIAQLNCYIDLDEKNKPKEPVMKKKTNQRRTLLKEKPRIKELEAKIDEKHRLIAELKEEILALEISICNDAKAIDEWLWLYKQDEEEGRVD